MSSILFRANRQRVTDTSGVLALLRIESASFGAPFLLANDTQSWVSNGDTYIGFPFAVKLPNDKDGENAVLELEIDNLGFDLTAELESKAPGVPVRGTLILADRATPNIHDFRFSGELINVSGSQETINAQISNAHKLDRSVTLLRHNPQTSPGIFS